MDILLLIFVSSSVYSDAILHVLTAFITTLLKQQLSCYTSVMTSNASQTQMKPKRLLFTRSDIFKSWNNHRKLEKTNSCFLFTVRQNATEVAILWDSWSISHERAQFDAVCKPPGGFCLPCDSDICNWDKVTAVKQDHIKNGTKK